MAHVGVPRRDPCQKCQLPVFLAERLTVGKKVYHRTCLKCARCGSQLTPGSFYETEVDDEYCCETCPDEEEIANNEMAAAASSVTLRPSTSTEDQSAAAPGAIHAKPTTVRSSIAERLAFFEQSKNGSVGGDAKSSKLLQKSVSDEEKSKSLKRMEATATTPSTSAYKMNTALSSFLNDTIDGAGNDDEENSAASTGDSNKSDTQMETSDTDDDNETEDDSSLEHKQPIISTLQTPPELPTTLPPMPAVAVEMRKVEDTATVDSPTASRRRFTATAQLQLVTAPAETQNEKEEVETELKLEPSSQQQTTKDESEDTISKSDKRMKTEIQFDVTTSTATTTNDNTNNNIQQQHEATTTEAVQTPPTTTTAAHSNKLTQIKSLEEINLDISQIIDNDNCVTKDKIADTKNADTDTTAATQAQNTSATSATVIEGNHIEEIQIELQKLESESSTDMDVESELEQETEPNPTVELRAKPAATEHLVADEATTERLSVVRARLQQFEVIANKDNNNTKSPEDNNVSNSNIDSLSESGKNIVNSNQATVVNAKLLEPETVEPKSMPQEKLLNEETKLNEMEIDNETESKKLNESLNEVPSNTTIKEAIVMNETKDNSNIGIKPEIVIEKAEDTNEQKVEEDKDVKNVAEKQQSPVKSPQKQVEVAAAAPTTASNQYPEDLNPFASDDEGEETVNKENIQRRVTPQPRTNISAKSASAADTSLNPFDSSDDEIELEKSHNSTAASTPSSTSATGLGGKVPPPRPPPPRISRNPFGDGADTDEDANSFSRRSSLSSSLTKKTPVPTPRSNVSLSQNPTPEPTPRLSNKTAQSSQQQPLQNSSDYYGSANSLGITTPNSNNNGTPQSLQRNSDIRGSNNSLTSSAGGTIRSRKNRKAPPPPAPVKELFPSTETIGSSKASTPSSSTMGTPKSGRKKRPAPAPPKPARLDPNMLPQLTLEEELGNGKTTASKNSLSYPLQSELDSKLSDEEKALLEGKQLQQQMMMASSTVSSGRRRLIPLDASLLEDNDLEAEHRSGRGDGTCTSDDVKQQQQHQYQHHGGDGAGDGEEYEPNVVYRRMLIPPKLDTPTHESNPLLDELNAAAQHDRQLEKLKDNKEAQNRNRQSQISAASSGNEDGDPAAALYNKSSHGKWKRRKGPAPALPIPQRKILQMLPLQEIRHELEIIEVQQQGLEKQGVILEKMIRDRCEGENGELLGVATTTVPGGVSEDVSDGGKTSIMPENIQNSKEVEDLILQLFELVNEKNELFRRQAELMYLRRQHRLEQEQADLEYEIRVLMAQPERNKTDTDKAREEALIARLVDVVQLRNAVVDCLEMDRLREAEEDMSIKQRLEMHTSKRDGGGDEDTKKTSAKLSKKEKKKQKEAKKLSKSKKIDADKDADETELNMDKQKLKKKKKKFTFLSLN